MGPETTAALIKGGSDLGSGLLNQIFYRRNLGLQTQASKDLMSFEDQLNVKNWNLENEYNLPVNQYQRYIDAGMSPAAAMQAVAGGSSPAGIGSVSPASPTAPAGSFDLGGVADAMLTAREVESKRELNDTAADVNRATAERTRTLTPVEKENIKSQTLKNYDDVATNESLRAKYEAEADRICSLTPVEQNKIVEETNMIVQKIEETKEAIKNLKKQRDVYDSEISRNEASANQMATETQGQVYENYNKYVESLKRSITAFLVDNYHINPDDSFWNQLIEAGSKGEDYVISFVQCLARVAESAESTTAKELPYLYAGGKKVVGAAALYYALHKLYQLRGERAHSQHAVNQTVTDALEIVGKVLSSFASNSVIDSPDIWTSNY